MRNVVFVLVLFIAGCGFHLRGTIIIPKHLQFISISPDTPYEPFQRELRHTLNRNGVTILPKGTKDVVTLHLSEPIYSEELMALGNDNQAGQLRVKIIIQYALYDPDGKLLQRTTTITSSKDISVDSEDLLSADAEKESLKHEIRQDIALKLIRMLSKSYPNKNVSKIQESEDASKKTSGLLQ